MLVKLVQILKLKKNAQKSTIDFMLGILNQQTAEEGEVVRENGVEFFDYITQMLNKAGVRLSEKEHFVMEGQAHVV